MPPNLLLSLFLASLLTIAFWAIFLTISTIYNYYKNWQIEEEYEKLMNTKPVQTKLFIVKDKEDKK